MKSIDALDIELIRASAYKAKWFEQDKGLELKGYILLHNPDSPVKIRLDLLGTSVSPSFGDAFEVEELLKAGWLDDDACLRSVNDSGYLYGFFKTVSLLLDQKKLPQGQPSAMIPKYEGEPPELTLAREDALEKAGGLEAFATEALREAMARVGQDVFRKKLDERWYCRCAVTGISAREVLRASHIKPWVDSTDEERMDPNNGLLLSANLDALFDKGLITFASDGSIVFSEKLSADDREKLGLTESMSLKQRTPEQDKYMEYHRGKIFKR